MSNPRRGGGRALAAAGWVVAGLAAGTLVLPRPWSQASGWAMVLVLLGAPTARVAACALRWWRGGDRRFARWALALLSLLALGVVVAVAQRGGG